MTNTTSIPAPDALRDIKPPIDIVNYWFWFWVAIGVLVLASVIVWLALHFGLRRKQIAAPPVLPAHVRAKHKLEEALGLIAQPKPFCTTVSDTIRLYLEERFEFRAPERTTEEFLYELKKTDLLLPDQKESLGEFLKRCDLVKFARYEPREPELRDLHGSAVRLIDETEPQPESAVAEPEPAAAAKL